MHIKYIPAFDFVAGADFTPGRYNATFTPGATKATASIPIMIDSIVEETEQFNLRLYIDGAGYGLGLQSGNVRNATAFIMQPNITGNYFKTAVDLHYVAMQQMWFFQIVSICVLRYSCGI